MNWPGSHTPPPRKNGSDELRKSTERVKVAETDLHTTLARLYEELEKVAPAKKNG